MNLQKINTNMGMNIIFDDSLHGTCFGIKKQDYSSSSQVIIACLQLLPYLSSRHTSDFAFQFLIHFHYVFILVRVAVGPQCIADVRLVLLAHTHSHTHLH